MDRSRGPGRISLIAGGSATLAVLGCAGLLALAYQKVTSVHHRPHGHQDISFDLSPTDELVVFNARGEGGRDLYLLNLQTQKVQRVAATPAYESAPSFSPDGKSLVYAAGIPGDRADHIFIRPLDGGAAQQLTFDDQNDRDPHWSADGRRIVFARNPFYAWGGLAASWNGSVLCVMRSDGSKLRRLTRPDQYAAAPRFFAAGEQIVFRRMDGLATIGLDDGRAIPLLHDAAVGGAAVSPDGQRIAFSKGRYASDCEIYLADADGANIRQLTRQKGCFHPVFAGDGKSVFYFVESRQNGPAGSPTYSLWRIAPDGENRRMVARSDLFDDPMNWRP